MPHLCRASFTTMPALFSRHRLAPHVGLVTCALVTAAHGIFFWTAVFVTTQTRQPKRLGQPNCRADSTGLPRGPCKRAHLKAFGPSNAMA